MLTTGLRITAEGRWCPSIIGAEANADTRQTITDLAKAAVVLATGYARAEPLQLL